MSIGTRIIQLRNQKGLSQRQLSDRTGLAASYISRIENRHLEPRPHTLSKIALALGVPMSEIFQERATQLGTLQCVITSSGTCILNLLHSSHGKRVYPGGESYNPRQLQLLRMANYLIQTSGKRVLDSLDVLLGALLNAELHKTPPSGRIPPPAIGEVGSGDQDSRQPSHRPGAGLNSL
ncbi:MAG: helix-turn-helix transcriptional regulator [Terriglobia bacterium]|jgi:transcriptional regulator with XRE-family HTH domain